MLALGNFDGMHLGHQAIVHRAGEIAREQKRTLAVMTFEPHPREFLNPNQSKPAAHLSVSPQSRIVRRGRCQHPVRTTLQPKIFRHFSP